MKSITRELAIMLKKAAADFIEDDCFSMAAALAYYTVFSLPPLLVLVLTITGAFVDPRRIEELIEGQAQGVVHEQGIEQLDTMIEGARQTGPGTLATVMGIGVLLFASTTVLAQLQYSLNRVWEVTPDPQLGGIKNFVVKRVLSLAMILAIAFLLLVSLVLTAALAAATRYLGAYFPDGWAGRVFAIGDFAISLGMITVLFAAIFQVLPDARIRWRDVWVGALLTALLFVLGKFLLGQYLGRSGIASAYGAASSLVLILLWVYYSALILLLGAEFTQAWCRRFGHRIVPEPGAVRAVEEHRELRSPQEANEHDRQEEQKTQ
jgi:membrane protein